MICLCVFLNRFESLSVPEWVMSVILLDTCVKTSNSLDVTHGVTYFIFLGIQMLFLLLNSNWIFVAFEVSVNLSSVSYRYFLYISSKKEFVLCKGKMPFSSFVLCKSCTYCIFQLQCICPFFLNYFFSLWRLVASLSQFILEFLNEQFKRVVGIVVWIWAIISLIQSDKLKKVDTYMLTLDGKTIPEENPVLYLCCWTEFLVYGGDLSPLCMERCAMSSSAG